MKEPWQIPKSVLEARWRPNTGAGYRGGERNVEAPPRVGTWRVDPPLNDLEQLCVVSLDDVQFTESIDDPGIVPSVTLYTQWWRDGYRPPPPVMVRHASSRTLQTLNRRRVLAAMAAGFVDILAWVSETLDDGASVKHKDVVKGALMQGLPVPRAVLDEYPDL